MGTSRASGIEEESLDTQCMWVYVDSPSCRPLLLDIPILCLQDHFLLTPLYYKWGSIVEEVWLLLFHLCIVLTVHNIE